MSTHQWFGGIADAESTGMLDVSFVKDGWFRVQAFRAFAFI